MCLSQIFSQKLFKLFFDNNVSFSCRGCQALSPGVQLSFYYQEYFSVVIKRKIEHSAN